VLNESLEKKIATYFPESIFSGNSFILASEDLPNLGDQVPPPTGENTPHTHTHTLTAPQHK